MRFVLLLMCGLLLVSSCKKDKIKVEDDLPYLNFSFSTSNESLMKGVPRNDMSKYNSVLVLMYSYNDTETYNPKSLPSTLPSYGKVKLSNADGTGTIWNYAPPKFWPTNRKLAFFAYSSDLSLEDGGITISDYQSGIPTITYSVPTDVKKQPDLLVSTPVVDMTKESNDGLNKIKLSMNHALSCISFAPVSNLERKIESIKIKNVYGTADLKMSDIPSGVKYPKIEWRNYKNKDDITFSAGINTNVNIPRELPKDLLPQDLSYLMNSDGYLMMIPQALEDAKIVVKYSDVDTPIEVDIPTMEWEAGKKYIYSWGSGGVVTYYEIYADGNVGFYYYDIDGTPKDNIRNLPDVDNAGIVEAGYGVLSYGPTTARIKWGDSEISGVNAMFGVTAKVGGTDFHLYPVSQTALSSGSKGPFTLIPTNTPQKMYINGEPTYGYCLPHFAKGIYRDKSIPTEDGLLLHYIRTPQQMMNISVNTYQDHDTYPYTNYTAGCKYRQQHNLDFGVAHLKIGGQSSYSSSIVGHPSDVSNYKGEGCFNGEYWAEGTSIKNMKIEVFDIVEKNIRVGLFRYVGTSSIIRLLTLESSCSVTAHGEVQWLSSAVGGIVGLNTGKLRDNENRANVYAPQRRNVGGICGYMTVHGVADVMKCRNRGNITGGATAGGILGACDTDAVDNPSAYLYIENCFTYDCTVESTTAGLLGGAGGICGMIPGYGKSVIIRNCVNSGTDVKSMAASGGILGITSIGKSEGGTTGGRVELYNCAVFEATVIGEGTNAGSGQFEGIGGIVGSASMYGGSQGKIVLDDMLYVNSATDKCPVTSLTIVDDINPPNVHVGGIVGYAHFVTGANCEIGDCVYIGMAPEGTYNDGSGNKTYLYPVVGDNEGAVFKGSFYYLKSDKFNALGTRFNLAEGRTTDQFAIETPTYIAAFLNPSYWESKYSGIGTYPYPQLKVMPAYDDDSRYPIPIPTAWPVANDAKRTLK